MFGLGRKFKQLSHSTMLAGCARRERGYYQNHAEYTCAPLLAQCCHLANFRHADRINGFYLTAFGRSGNLYVALRNAMLLCAQVGASRLYTGFGHPLFNFNTDPDSVIIQAAPATGRLPHNTLVPNYPWTFLQFNPWEAPDAATLIPTIKKRLRAMLRVSPHTLDNDTLVVHLRAGDVFSRFSPTEYRQPPLAWYKRCIQAHGQFHPSLNVVLLFEDTANPCIYPLYQWCQVKQIPVRLQFSSLQDDYGCMMSARALVTSYGTFSQIAVDLSDSLRNVYEFKDAYCETGSYIPIGRWYNTPEQKALMVDLQDDKLRIPPDLYYLSQQFRRFGVPSC